MCEVRRVIAVVVFVCLLCGCDRSFRGYDSDGDGWLNQQDCEPMNADVHPDAAETCGDHRDNNCNGEADETCKVAVADRRKDSCATSCDWTTRCWTGPACGVNASDDAVCWGPYVYSPVHRPLDLADAGKTWLSYPCGVTAFGEVECLGPAALDISGALALGRPRTSLDPPAHLPRATAALPHASAAPGP